MDGKRLNTATLERWSNRPPRQSFELGAGVEFEMALPRLSPDLDRITWVRRHRL